MRSVFASVNVTARTERVPHHRKERFKEPEHAGPPGVAVALKLFAVFAWASMAQFSVSGGSERSHQLRRIYIHRDTVREYARLRGGVHE